MNILTKGLRLTSGIAQSGVRRHRSIATLRAHLRGWSFRQKLRRLRQRHSRVRVVALLEHVGDLIAASPIVHELRRNSPRTHIVWIVAEPWRELAAQLGGADEVWCVGCITEWGKIAPTLPPEELLDLHVPGRYCPICHDPYLPANSRATFDLEDYYEHGSLLDVYAALAGVEVTDPVPRLAVAGEVMGRVDALQLPKSFVAIHGRSRQKSRDWDDAKWSRLCTVLGESGIDVVEIGEDSVLSGREPGRDLRRPRSLCGRLSILESAEVIRRATLFVGIDSGPAHLANAVGTPGVVLLGRYKRFTDHVPWSGPYADPGWNLVLRAEGPAADLAVDEVAGAVLRRWQERVCYPGRISVVIPAYGHAHLIGETLDSVLGQEEVDVEVIVVDDGSPDDTRRVVAGRATDERIRYVRQPNAGPAAARNTGLRLARGEFVVFLDDDDVLPAGSLATLSEPLRRDRRWVGAYGKVRSSDPEQPVGHDLPLPSGYVAEAFLARNWLVSLGQALFRTEEVRAAGGFDSEIWGSDDWDLLVRISRRGALHATTRTTLEYRVHGTNASRQALRHAESHWRVVKKHYGSQLLRRRMHAREAAAYFVPNLMRRVRQAESERDGRAMRQSLWMASRFTPSLWIRPWFVRALIQSLGLRNGLESRLPSIRPEGRTSQRQP